MSDPIVMEVRGNVAVKLPNCMMPDGADPCPAFCELYAEVERLRAAFPPGRFYVEVPDKFAIARWPRDADVATIARCILGTLKYEPHSTDTTELRHALENVVAAFGPQGAR
jgi:hypothetical protein